MTTGVVDGSIRSGRSRRKETIRNESKLPGETRVKKNRNWEGNNVKKTNEAEEREKRREETGESTLVKKQWHRRFGRYECQIYGVVKHESSLSTEISS